MKFVEDHFLGTAVALLVEMQVENVKPREGQHRVDELWRACEDVDLKLVWEEEAYDGRFHYDLLVRRGTTGTLSLSYSREDALPWPLRGIRRTSESDLLRVNTVTLRVMDAMSQLDYIWNDRRILRRLIDSCLVQEAIQEQGIMPDRGAIQTAVDGFRRARRLYSRESMEAWLAKEGVTLQQLEAKLHGAASLDILRQRLTHTKTTEWIQANQSALELLSIGILTFKTEAAAGTAAAALREGESFGSLTEHLVNTEAMIGGQGVSAEIKTLRRMELDEPLAKAMANALPGTIVGPSSYNSSWQVAKLLVLCPGAGEAPQLEAFAATALFQEWLDRRRATADIEWYWGREDEGLEAVP